MSGDFLYTRAVGPARCVERPWDSWVGELGHSSPRRDEPFAPPAEPDLKSAARRPHEHRPHKHGERHYARHRRKGVNRLRHDTMSLHGLFPQMDNLNAAVCHMCGTSVKCSAAYRHLVVSHAAGMEPILPPPPPTVKLKPAHSRSRHKKEPVVPPPPPEIVSLPAEMSASLPVLVENGSVNPGLSMPVCEPHYAEDSLSQGDVQVRMEGGELPVVSIQDPDDLALGDNITDDIFAIMNSEGIQSADDIADVTDWKNIIRDIGSMQDLAFSTPDAPDAFPAADTAPPALPALPALALTDADLTGLALAGTPPPERDAPHDARSPGPVTPAPAPKSHSRSKSSKTKHNKEYDPDRHCGVLTADGRKPCLRSLTCKAHALSMRRAVEGRSKTFDTLLAEHRAARDPAPHTANTTHAVTAPTLPPDTFDPAAFPGISRRADDVYARLVSEVASAVCAGGVGSAGGVSSAAEGSPAGGSVAVPPETPAEVCWYASVPRPLALCTFGSTSAGGAVCAGRRGAGPRAAVKASCGRSARGPAAPRPRARVRPEARRLVVWRRPTLNGHVRPHHRHKLLDLGFPPDALLAEDGCPS